MLPTKAFPVNLLIGTLWFWFSMKDVLNVWVCDERSLQPGFISKQGREGGKKSWEKEGEKEQGGKVGGRERETKRGQYIESWYKGAEYRANTYPPSVWKHSFWNFIIVHVTFESDMMPPHMAQGVHNSHTAGFCLCYSLYTGFVILLLGEDKSFERNAVDVSGTPDKRGSCETYSRMSHIAGNTAYCPYILMDGMNSSTSCSPNRQLPEFDAWHEAIG